jgi:hypothetical protein
VEGVNTPLTSRVSGIREIREREFNIETCEVASSENARRKVNIASRGFVKGRCQGWMPQLAKWRVARGASVKPSRWSRVEGADREELYPFRDLGYREIGKEESGASTHELASCELRQAPLELGLGHSVVVAWKRGASCLVLFAQGSFRKDLWIDNL